MGRVYVNGKLHNMSYYTSYHAQFAMKIMDKMRSIAPNAYQIPVLNGKFNPHTVEAKYRQGGKYLIDNIDKTYTEVFESIVVRVSRDKEENASCITFDWRSKDATRAPDIDAESLLQYGNEIPTYNRKGRKMAKAIKAKTQEMENRIKDSGVVSTANREFATVYMDAIMQYVEQAPLEASPLIRDNLQLTEDEVLQIVGLLEDTENVLFEISEERIFVHKTSKKML